MKLSDANADADVKEFDDKHDSLKEDNPGGLKNTLHGNIFQVRLQNCHKTGI